MPRALITGITGQDGSYLAEFLLEKGYEVFGLVRRTSNPNYTNIEHIRHRVTLLEGDLLDQSSLMLALAKSLPDEVYNLAAMSHVGLSFSQPVATMETTGLGCTRLLEAIRLSGLDCKFYQASSSEIIGQEDQRYYKPRSPYAAAKLYAHWTVNNYRDGYGLFACSGILYNHESPRRGVDFVTRKITRGVARIKYGLQEKIALGNLNTYRDWGFAGDYVEAMWLMLQQQEPDDYVIATGQSHCILEVADLAFRHVGVNHWIDYIKRDESMMRPTDVVYLVGDASKAQRVLGWQPRVSFEELVAMMVDSDIKEVEREIKSSAYSFPDSRGVGCGVLLQEV